MDLKAKSKSHKLNPKTQAKNHAMNLESITTIIKLHTWEQSGRLIPKDTNIVWNHSLIALLIVHSHILFYNFFNHLKEGNILKLPIFIKYFIQKLL